MTDISALDGVSTTVRPVAKILNCSPSSIYAAIKDGSFPFPVIRIGERIVIPTAPIRKALGIDEKEVA